MLFEVAGGRPSDALVFPDVLTYLKNRLDSILWRSENYAAVSLILWPHQYYEGGYCLSYMLFILPSVSLPPHQNFTRLPSSSRKAPPSTISSTMHITITALTTLLSLTVALPTTAPVPVRVKGRFSGPYRYIRLCLSKISSQQEPHKISMPARRLWQMLVEMLLLLIPMELFCLWLLVVNRGGGGRVHTTRSEEWR